MTQEEFLQTSFGKGDQAVYKGQSYLIRSVDFEERLIGLHEFVEGCDDPQWVRCESVDYIRKE